MLSGRLFEIWKVQTDSPPHKNRCRTVRLNGWKVASNKFVTLLAEIWLGVDFTVTHCRHCNVLHYKLKQLNVHNVLLLNNEPNIRKELAADIEE